MKKIIVILSLIFICFVSFGQNINHSVISDRLIVSEVVKDNKVTIYFQSFEDNAVYTDNISKLYKELIGIKNKIENYEGEYLNLGSIKSFGRKNKYLYNKTDTELIGYDVVNTGNFRYIYDYGKSNKLPIVEYFKNDEGFSLVISGNEYKSKLVYDNVGVASISCSNIQYIGFNMDGGAYTGSIHRNYSRVMVCIDNMESLNKVIEIVEKYI